MSSGEKIILRGMADESLHNEAGDIVLIIRENDSSDFKRKGEHLIINRDVKLCDALCGYSFNLKHIDDTELLIQSDNIIKPGKIFTVLNKGMPIKNRQGNYGNLYIIYSVIFPMYSDIKQADRDMLKKILPNDNKKIKELPETHILMETDNIENNYDNDSEHHNGQQHVECNQQ